MLNSPKYSQLLILLIGSALTLANSNNGTASKPVLNQTYATEIIREDSLKVLRNLRYAMASNEFKNDSSSDRTLDLYLPLNYSKKSMPTVVFIHGGGFVGGDKWGTSKLCTRLAGLGYAVASINYRLNLKVHKSSTATKGLALAQSEGGNFPISLNQAIAVADEDAQLALNWIRENASKYYLDLSKVAIGGGSAGSITALYTAYASNQHILPIRAVINFWGAIDKPVLVGKSSIPLITYHGDQDDKINVDFAYSLERAKNDRLSETHIMKDKGHGQYEYIAQKKLGEIDAFLKKVFDN